jgi:hypothetical protein
MVNPARRANRSEPGAYPGAPPAKCQVNRILPRPMHKREQKSEKVKNSKRMCDSPMPFGRLETVIARDYYQPSD